MAFYQVESLARVASGYAPEGLVASMVFPNVPSRLQTGVFYNIDPNRQFLIPRDNVRAYGKEPNAMDYDDPTTSSYNAIDHSLEGAVPDELVKQADDEAKPAFAEVKRLTYNIALKREIELVTTLGTLSQTGSPSTKWDANGGDAIADIKAQFSTIEDSVGVSPNMLVMDRKVARKITDSASFRDRAKYTMTPDQVRSMGTAALLAALLDIPVGNVYLPSAHYNSAAKGATASMTRIWDENVLLGFKEDGLSIGQPTQTLGMHVTWSGSSGSGVDGFEVDTEEVKSRKATVMYVHNYYDQVLVNPTAGYWFTNTLT